MDILLTERLSDWTIDLSINCLIVIDSSSPLNLVVDVLLASGSSVQGMKSQAVDFRSLLDEIYRLTPRVIMIEERGMLSDGCTLMKLLEADLDLKIVLVSSESNQVRVFQKDEILIQSASEFLEIIQMN